MTKSIFVLSLIVLLSITKSADTDSVCNRVHKAWHLIPESEKNQFISAIHKLNANGKLARFSTTHHFIIDSAQAHSSSSFFAWHRYFLIEFENQIRELGPEYKCFSTPYWDVTHDAGELENSYIYRSGIGGCGDINNYLCVDVQNNGAWSREQYPLKHVCHSEEDSADNLINGCCLKRGVNPGGDLSGISGYVQYIKHFTNFGGENGFRQATFIKIHGQAHGFIGGTLEDYTQMISRYSPEDPTFWLLHCWLDYVFEIWKNCYGYNLIDVQQLDEHTKAYEAYPVDDADIPNSELDTVLKYIPMTDVDWWNGDIVNPTARKMWNPKDWDISFERGTFIENSHLTHLCEYEWDEQVINENSEMTQNIIDKQTGSTDIEQYEMKVWNQLNALQSSVDSYDESDFIQTWDSKTCNYQRQRMGKSPCNIPLDYEKCAETDLHMHAKNEITIDELLSKQGVNGNECLEDVRKNMYGYAKSMGLLYELCMGVFDEFQVCTIPNIDIILEDDDTGYYAKLNAIKNRMKRESEQGIIAPMIIDEMEEENSGISSSYPQFDVFISFICGFILIGLLMMTLMKRCCDSETEYDPEYVLKRRPSARTKMYGSLHVNDQIL